MQALVIPVGTEEGFPVSIVITEDELDQAKKDGLSESDLIEIEASSYRHWQADC